MKSVDQVDAFVGSRVRFRRVTIGMSQEQLGSAIGLTFQQIQKYEKGLNRIGAGRLYRIAQILSVPVHFFYEGLPNPSEEGDFDAVNDRATEIQEFLATTDGHALAQSFLEIKDSATRRRLIDLVRTIAVTDE